MVGKYVGGLLLPISVERLESYRPADGSDLDMIVNYYWNLCLCESLYPTLNATEVALRNSIHTALTAHYNDDCWFDDENIVETDEYKRVGKARRKLRDLQRPENPGRIVAELSFGFWVAMLNRPYEKKFWAPNKYAILRTVFPSTTRKARKRGSLRDRFFEINLLRNRVFHYEPVWNQANLIQQHQNILEAIGWISPVQKELTQLFDRFPEVFRDGRNRVEADLKNYMGIPLVGGPEVISGAPR